MIAFSQRFSLPLRLFRLLGRGEAASPWTLDDLWSLILNAVGDISAAGSDLCEEVGNEADLVRSIASGNGDAAEELYRRYSARVFRFIYRRIGEQIEDAEEVTLDTFLSAIELAPSFSGKASVFVWLCGIAKLRIIDFQRHHSRSKRSSKNAQITFEQVDEMLRSERGRPGKSVEELLDRVHASQLVDAALSCLSEHEREALILRFVDGLSTREIAQVMKRSERAVESLVLRARSRPRDFLQRVLGEEAPR